MINVHKRNIYLVFTVYFVLFTCGINFSLADTNTIGTAYSTNTTDINSSSVNSASTNSQSTFNYTNLNISTKSFVDRLNQLPQDFSFNKNLRRNQDVLPDVKYLKWILNSDQRTALTDNPSMTLDELSSSFGPITEAAVKKFQTLYRSEILDPQGIANATGIVGVATRKKLNWFISQSRALLINANNGLLNAGLSYNISNPNYTNNYVYFPYYNADGSANNSLVQTSQASSSTYTDGTYLTSTDSTSSMLTTSDSTTVLSTSASSNANSGVGALGILGVLGGAALLSGALSGGAGAAAGTAGSAAGSAAGGVASKAATQVVLSQFGGRVILNMLCPCSANYLITVYDLSLMIPLSIIFQPGISTLKMNYNPTIGQIVLGGYVRGPAKCLVYVGSGCSPYGLPFGVIDTLRGVGTTLAPIK